MQIINLTFEDNNLEWTVEVFLEKTIKDIYVDIIEKIILKINEFKDYDYIYSILNQIDLLNIDLTKSMFDKISIILNNNKEYMNKYIILEKKDLNDEKKLIFIIFY